MGCRKCCRKRCRCPCDEEEEVDPCAPAAAPPPPPPPPPAARPPPPPPPPPPPAARPPPPPPVRAIVVAPPPPPPVDNARPPPEVPILLPPPSKEKDKVIATLFRALPFSGKVLGTRLDGALGQSLGQRISKNKNFSYFQKNLSSWSTVFNNKYTGAGTIDDYLIAVETDPPVPGSKSKLSNYILSAYRASPKISNWEKQFVKIFFDLICAFYSVYKDTVCKTDMSDTECIQIIYGENFKEFFDKDVLKLFNDKNKDKSIDVHTYIINAIVEYSKKIDDEKTRAKEIYGGRRRTRKMKKAKKHTRRK